MAVLTSGRGGSAVIAFMLRSRWLPPLVGAVVVAMLAVRLGAAPFIAGVRAVTGWSLATATGIGVVTTVCSAWRWSVVSRRLGVELDVKRAVAMYYRAQFLNTVLPGGVLGDVHRGVRQGRDAGSVSRGVRSVVYERLAGQAVQLLITAVILIVLPSPLPSAATFGLSAGGCLLLVAAAVWVWLRRANQRGVVRAWSKVAAASVVVVAGYTTMFVVAARVSGVQLATVRLLPLAVLVLAAMALPTNIGGWGPREGMAAWVFGLAGVGSSVGLTTATVYGVMAIVSCAPGGIVLAAGWVRNRREGSTQPRWFGSIARHGWVPVAEPKGGTGG